MKLNVTFLAVMSCITGPVLASSGPGLTPVILSNGWPIRKVQANDRGSVAFIGGGYYYGDSYSSSGIADGAVLITGNGIDKFAAVGDPVPGRPGKVFAGFEFKSLSNNDEVAFVALTLPAGDNSNCLQIPWPSSCVPGLYLYSGGHIQELALSGEPSPYASGIVFQGFGSPQLNNRGMLALTMGLYLDGSVTEGYYLFDGNTFHKIVQRGETSPLFGPIGYLDGTFLLSDSGVFTFCLNGIVAQYANGGITRVFASGDSIAGGSTVLPFDHLVGMSGNRRGEIVFETSGVPYENSGLYLLRRDGSVVRILTHGDLIPSDFGSGTFTLTYKYRSSSLPQTGLSDLNAQVNDSGEVLFVSPVVNNDTAAGFFLYSGGRIRFVAHDGEPLPSNPSFTIRFVATDNFSYYTLLNNISFGPLGQIIFAAWRAAYPIDYSHIGIFKVTSDEGTVESLEMDGDPAPGTGGQFSNLFFGFVATNAFGDVLFLSNLRNSGYSRGIFRLSLPSPDVPNPGFEILTKDGLPEHWTTTWTNYGNGLAWDYDSGGQDSFEGDADLRLELASSGGAIFAVSGPIPVSPGTDYYLQCRMRYNLTGASDSIYFTVIQSDTSGNTVGFVETKGIRGDNFWTWQPKRLLFHTAPNAAIIRIRFGLTATDVSYLDIDAVSGRDSP
jgi:hypothetical protein